MKDSFKRKVDTNDEPKKQVKKVNPKHQQEQERLFTQSDAISPVNKKIDKAELVMLNGGKTVNIHDFVQENYVEYYPHYPKPFFTGIAKLYGIDEKLMDEWVKPQIVPNFINKYIYERFPTGVLQKIQMQNPYKEYLSRQFKHFQFLTIRADIELNGFIDDVLRLMETCNTIMEFDNAFYRKFIAKVKPELFR